MSVATEVHHAQLGEAAEVAGLPGRRREWDLETILMGLLGAIMVTLWLADRLPHVGIVPETIILVLGLGAIMGLTRLPFPTRLFGRPIPLYMYPVVSGIVSGFMDSFLVLMMIGVAKLSGSARDQFRFRVYNTVAALIGGLIMYFGEVYMLPLALKYGMREWHSMLPVVPPVIVFLGLLAWLTSKLKVEVLGVGAIGQSGQQTTKRDYIEFAAFIVLLLLTHNAIFCLGALLLYTAVLGRGHDLIHVVKTETEVNVMLILFMALLLSPVLTGYMANLSGWEVFWPAVANGVLIGAIYPAAGDVWKEVHILSTAVLITPISSLVGVMLFKTMRDWVGFMKQTVPLAAVWFVICGAWFYLVWPQMDNGYYKIFPEPVLVQETNAPSPH